jgi:hypothetical protein
MKKWLKLTLIHHRHLHLHLHRPSLILGVAKLNMLPEEIR